jgi:DNA replication protein DnaC
MKDSITNYQKKLRLSNNLIDIYESIPYETKEQFIHGLLETLYNERLTNIMVRNMKYANFPVKKTLDSYEFTHVQLPEKLALDALCELKFLEEKQNLILYGNIGAGKTHLGIALGIKAIQQHKVVYFFTVHELINKLVIEKENGTYLRFMKKLKKADLLILDEWGYLPLHQEGARLLFEVISMCYEQKSIIITTNIEFSHWKNFLFDEKLTAAIIDRVVHHSHLLFFDGPSHRKQNALLKS